MDKKQKLDTALSKIITQSKSLNKNFLFGLILFMILIVLLIAMGAKAFYSISTMSSTDDPQKIAEDAVAFSVVSYVFGIVIFINSIFIIVKLVKLLESTELVDAIMSEHAENTSFKTQVIFAIVFMFIFSLVSWIKIVKVKTKAQELSAQLNNYKNLDSEITE